MNRTRIDIAHTMQPAVSSVCVGGGVASVKIFQDFSAIRHDRGGGGSLLPLAVETTNRNPPPYPPPHRVATISTAAE